MPSGSRTRDSHAGGGRSNKERQRLQSLERLFWGQGSEVYTQPLLAYIRYTSKVDLNTWKSFTRSELKLESVHQESPRLDIFRKRATKPLLKQKHRQKHLAWAKEKKNWTVAQWSKVEGCIGFGLQRDPTQISREVLPLLSAGVGGQKILRETHGERWDLECNRNVIETHEVEKKIQVTVYLTKAKQGKSDIWKRLSIATEKNGKELNLVSLVSHKCAKVFHYNWHKSGTSALRRHT